MPPIFRVIAAMSIIALLWNLCSHLNPAAAATSMTIEKQPFGKLDDGTEVYRYVLTAPDGANVHLTNFAATLMHVNVPDRDGELANVNFAFDSIDGYLADHPYFGSTVGRYANRIGGAAFTIDGTRYELAANEGENILHGGPGNWARQCWREEGTIERDDRVGVTFVIESPDGHNGFPGNVTARATYLWAASPTGGHELTFQYSATTDAPTHVSLTNHSYWNLRGAGTGSAMDHVATIAADQLLAVDDKLIPTGEMRPVDGTLFDFRSPRAFGQSVDDESLGLTKGYDHCFVVRGPAGSLRDVATVHDPASGREMSIKTTMPGVQLYTGNWLGGGPDTAGASSHDAFCLETQYFPNTPNVDSFEGTLLRPGGEWSETTTHRFGVRR